MLEVLTEQSTTHEKDKRTSSIRNTSKTVAENQY